MRSMEWQNHSPIFKGQVAIATLKGYRALAGLAQQFDVHPNQITDWTTQQMERSEQVFGESTTKAAEPDSKRMTSGLVIGISAW